MSVTLGESRPGPNAFAAQNGQPHAALESRSGIWETLELWGIFGYSMVGRRAALRNFTRSLDFRPPRFTPMPRCGQNKGVLARYQVLREN